jgi:ABC-type nickel/cobalt efflux system permease component RcnA
MQRLASRVKRIRAWLTSRPKSSRATIAICWIVGNVAVYLPRHPTLEVLEWAQLAAVAGLVITLALVVITQKRRRR